MVFSSNRNTTTTTRYVNIHQHFKYYFRQYSDYSYYLNSFSRSIVLYLIQKINIILFRKQLSRVVIYFKESQFMTSRRSELYGITDFLGNYTLHDLIFFSFETFILCGLFLTSFFPVSASCGGLLGLFSGFSILSLVEIIYYVTLRFWNNLKRPNLDKVPNGEQTNAFKYQLEDRKL